jgi:hypothetical protein
MLAKETSKKGSSQDTGLAATIESDGLHDVHSSDSEEAIFEVAKEDPVDILNPTLNDKGSLTNEERSVLWKMAQDADIRGDTMASSTIMSFLNEIKVTKVVPVTVRTKLAETAHPRLDLSIARSDFPGVVLNPTSKC